MITCIVVLCSSGLGVVDGELFGDEQERRGQGEKQFAGILSAENSPARSDEPPRSENEQGDDKSVRNDVSLLRQLVARPPLQQRCTLVPRV